MSRAARLAPVLVVAAASLLWPPARAAAADIEVPLRLYPKTSDVVVVTDDGDEARFDERGRGVIRVPSEQRLVRTLSVSRRSTLPRGVTAEVARVRRFGGRPGYAVTLELFYDVSAGFVDLAGRPVAGEVVDAITLRSSAGTRRTWSGSGPYRLLGKRVVALSGRLVTKNVFWTVDNVVVDGANVVNRSQTKFYPSRVARAGTPGWSRDPERGIVPIQLLFFSARFSARDALLGFRVGQGIELHHPNGEVSYHRFRENRELLLPNLPRGSYKVRVDAPGYSFLRPVALSRNQIVELEVLTWLDIGLVLGLGFAGAAGMILIGRPHLRHSLRPRRVAAGVLGRRRSHA